MNLLKDKFISTNVGKASLKDILTTDTDYQLQYFYDEIQLSMLQLLSSLSTALLQPTVQELKAYLANGLSEMQYDQALEKVQLDWFEDSVFMRSKPPVGAKWPDAPITKLISGVECGTSGNAIGLFSELDSTQVCCPDCTHVLNYNLHMNIKGECFGPTGATGIRGGGAISTLVSGTNLKSTLLSNALAVAEFSDYAQLSAEAIQAPMWVEPQVGKIYQAENIGLIRGLFALAYHIDFSINEKPCICDVCGSESNFSVTTFNREKYTGSYGSTKNGRDGGAGWWPHPYTPRSVREDGCYAVCARDQNWQSWQELSSYIVGKQTDKLNVEPAYVVTQYRSMLRPGQVGLLVGGNIADQGSVTGRVYDLYAMPSTFSRQLAKVTEVIDAGLKRKEKLSLAFNKMFGIGYDKNFVAGIKDDAINLFVSNAQQIIQQILLDVDRKEAKALREEAKQALKIEAKQIFLNVQKKYQHDLPLFKALVKGEAVFYAE